MCEPGFPLPEWICFCNTSPERGTDWSGGIQVGCPLSLTRCHGTLADLHRISLIFLPLRALLLRAMPGSVSNTAVFLSLLSVVPDIQPYFCCIAEEASRIYSWTIFLSWDSNISLPLPLPLPNHSDLQPCWYWRSSLLNPSLRFPFFPLLSSANCTVFIFRYAGNLIMKERLFFFLFLISTW